MAAGFLLPNTVTAVVILCITATKRLPEKGIIVNGHTHFRHQRVRPHGCAYSQAWQAVY